MQALCIVVIIFCPGKEDQESYRIAGPNIFSPKLMLVVAFFQVSYYVKRVIFTYLRYIIVDSIIRTKYFLII